MFTRSAGNVEHYDYGITRQMIHDNRITVVRTEGDMSRNGTNTWASLLILTMQEWKSNRPLAILHDLTHPNQGLTPYARERSLDLLNHIPDGLMVYSAVVLPPTFMHRIIDMFLRNPLFQSNQHQVRIFPIESLAIEWLEEQLANH